MLRYVVMLLIKSLAQPMVSQWPQFGPSRAKRFFEKGVLRFVLLDLLRDRPAHGYELIKALEERSHGFYTPSTGSVYPILQTLQDQDYVTSIEKAGKKVYTISCHGLEYLGEHSDIVKGLNNLAAHRGQFDKTEWQDTLEELRRIRQVFGRKAGSLTHVQKAKIRDAIRRACCEIETVIEQQ